MWYVQAARGEGEGENLPPLDFSLQTLTIKIKLSMMLDILLKSLSVEQNWGKNISIFVDIRIFR